MRHLPDTLHLLGGLHDGGDTIFLLGPRHPAFWPAFAASAEYSDGRPDPLDRYSKRVIGAVARDWQGDAIFPSDGPPYPPFIAWALATGRAWTSPVGLLVHEEQGLWMSFRGAVRVRGTETVPESGRNPCESCSGQPCRSACPVDAMVDGAYDVGTCRGWLNAGSGDCMAKGCAIRRACPVSAAYGRLDRQSAFHMKAFNPI